MSDREPLIPNSHQPGSLFSSVFVGELLIILDAISYGLLLFPTNHPAFANAGSDGISMFLVSTILSQIVYSFYSKFDCVNGSMMIEVIPFLHIISIQVASTVSPDEIMPTVIVTYAISAILSGLVFLLLGLFKLGQLMEFFPRHILIGTIGGVGYFLIQTAIEVSTQLKFQWSFSFLAQLCQLNQVFKWTSALALSLLLRLFLRFVKKPWFVSVYFASLPLVFYLIALLSGFSIAELRHHQWLFEFKSGSFYHFYSYIQFSKVNWQAIWPLMPTILSMSFFGLLHVPINVPALAISTNAPVNLNRELVAHGYSNIIAGLFMTNQNYLVYSNSVLFHKTGGTRKGTWCLALVTTLLWMVGMPAFSYLPILVVTALIFHIGLDLLKEALIDTWALATHAEYASIVLIIISMALIGFTEGVLIGVILACLFFVMQSSQVKVVRQCFSGATARSTIRRLYMQEKYLTWTGTQIQVVRLQGFLFFGTIAQLQDKIESLIGQDMPVRYLILDFKLTLGIDYSAAEAFVKVKQSCIDKRIILLLCGTNEEITKALKNNKCWEGDHIMTMTDLNGALEWSENALLRSYYRQTDIALEMVPQETVISYSPMNTFSPRHGLTREAFEKVFEPTSEAYDFLKQSILGMTDGDDGFYMAVRDYFYKQSYPRGHCLWEAGDWSDVLLIVEKGFCVLTETFQGHERTEIVSPGILMGGTGMLVGRNRTYRATVQSDMVCWEMSRQKMEELQSEKPESMVELMRMVMRYADAQFSHIQRQMFISNQ